MITPEVIRKIEDKRREKIRPTGERLPAHKEAPAPAPERKNPSKKQEDPSKNPDRIIEISVV